MSKLKPTSFKEMKRLFRENKRLQKEKDEAEKRAAISEERATISEERVNLLEKENTELKADRKKVEAELREKLNTLRLKIEEIIEQEKKASTKEEREKKQKEYQEQLKQLETLMTTVYGQKSEKRGSGQSDKKGGKGKKSRKKRTVQDIEPSEEEVLKLPEEELNCECCGGTFKEVDGKYTDQDIIEVQRLLHKMKRWRKQHYRCQCSRTKVAKGPKYQLIENGRYDISFAIQISVDKYLDHLPLTRQARAMMRDGFKVTSQTLWDQIFALAMVFKPIYQKIHDYLLCQRYLHSDFTSWYLAGKQTQKGGRKRMELMVINNHELAYFAMLTGNSRMEIASVLRDFDKTLVADGDLGFQRLANGKDRDVLVPYFEEVEDPNDKSKTIKIKKVFEILCNYTLAGCWSHARRPFFHAERKGVTCSQILDKIGELYAAEAEYKELAAGSRKALVEIRRNCRPKKSKKLVAEIYALKDELKRTAGTLAIGDLADGIKYLEGQETRLKVFLTTPEIEIDNNAAERLLRDAVQGRKNHYCSRSMNGIEVTSIFYSLFGSCKLLGLNPVSYMLTAFRAIKDDPNNLITPLDYQKNLLDSS